MVAAVMIVIIVIHAKRKINNIFIFRCMKIDLKEIITYDFSNLNLQEDSISNCYYCDSCDIDEGNGDSCDMCDSCDHGW